MSRLYGAQQRALQDRFDTRRIADKIEALAIHPELGDMEKAFIESRDMFWLSTIDEQGRPTVSYKGGDPGFVKAQFLEAQLVVRVAVTEVWPNCPRYVHRYQKSLRSRYVPRTQCETPLAGWKRIDIIQDDLPAADQGRAAKEGGLVTIEERFGKVGVGADDA